MAMNIGLRSLFKIPRPDHLALNLKSRLVTQYKLIDLTI